MVVVAATGSSIQLLASTASYAFSSTAIPLARNRGSPVTRITTKHVVFPAVGRTVCYNRPLVRPKNYGLENGFLRSKSSLNANAGTRTNGGGGSRSTNSCGSSRKFSTQGPSGTFYSTAGNSTSTTNGGVSGSPYASEAYTMFDKLFSTLLKGRRTQGKGKKKDFSTQGSAGARNNTHSKSDSKSSTNEKTRGRARLDSEEPSSANLAHCGPTPAQCQVFEGSLALIDTTMGSDDTWKQHRRTVLTLISRRPALLDSYSKSPSQQQREFHSSPQSHGFHFLLHAAAILKSSGALSVVQMVGRIALTLLPMALLKRGLFRKLIKHLPLSEHPTLETMHKHMQSSINAINIAMWGLIIVPGSLFVATFLASLERTPVTGRWRLILLSPEEEKSVADDLRGDGWRDAVANILTAGETEPLPRVIPLSDWRTQWVLQTWRHLESVVPLLQADDNEVQEIFDRRARAAASPRSQGEEDGPVSLDDIPFPPPSKYALMPRPRATTFLHSVAPAVTDLMEQENLAALSGQDSTHHDQQPHSTSQDPPAHTLLGPPYSLLVVEKPQSANAFSYGFGPGGAGGVVVYSGFIDEILKKTEQIIPLTDSESAASVAPVSEKSGSGWNLLSFFTGGSSSPAPSLATTGSTGIAQPYTTPTQYTPTAEQTTYLAILLAHELAHLVLSHHLETLSSNSILVPTVVGMFADLARTLAFPITMVFGPFVNDALWEVSKLGTGEVVRSSEACRVKGLEIEADLVGARLLAYAGWDARSAVKFWEEREANETCAEQTVKKGADGTVDTSIGSGHSLDGVWKAVEPYIPLREWWSNRMDSMHGGTWFTKSEAGVADNNDKDAKGKRGGHGGHPISAERVRRLRKELDRWDGEREKYMKHLELQPH